MQIRCQDILYCNRLRLSSAQAGRPATELVTEKLPSIERKQKLVAYVAVSTNKKADIGSKILYSGLAFRIAAWSLSAVTASGKTVMVSGVAPLTGMTMLLGVPVSPSPLPG